MVIRQESSLLSDIQAHVANCKTEKVKDFAQRLGCLRKDGSLLQRGRGAEHRGALLLLKFSLKFQRFSEVLRKECLIQKGLKSVKNC